MNTKTIKTAEKDIQAFFHKHGASIFMGLGIAGSILTVPMTAEATLKASRLAEQRKKELKYDSRTSLEPKEVIKTTWKCFVPVIFTEGLSIFFILKANSINHKNEAALLTTCTASLLKLKEYQKKTIDTIGKQQYTKIVDEIAKDKITEKPVVTQDIIVTNKGDTLCFDSYMGRYFTSDIEKIKKVINTLDRKMISENYITINDFYTELGLSSCKGGDLLGWNVDNGQLDVIFSSQLASDGRPCLVIDYTVEPRADYLNCY